MLKRILISIIKVYQKIFSPDTGLFVRAGLKKSTTCMFFPTCSEYTAQAIEKYGAIIGVLKGLKRLFRCHPWQTKHEDPLV